MKKNGYRLLLGFFSGLAAFLLSLAGLLQPLEWKSHDWRMAQTIDPAASSEEVALLLIDQASLDYMEEEEGIVWPWPRSLYVPAIEYCRAAGANGIIFDILFTEASMYGVEDDAGLAASMAERKDVVLAVHVPADEGEISWPVDDLRHSAAALGNVRFDPDGDGIFRAVPPAVSLGGGEILSLPFAALEKLDSRIIDRSDGALTVDGRTVPLDRDGSMLVRFLGPVGTVPSYSMAAAIQSFVRATEGGETALPAHLLENRYVFIGMSAPGLMDLRPTPISMVYPGTEVHATLLHNLLTENYTTPLPLWVELFRALFPAVLLAFLLGKIRSVWKGGLLLPLFIAVLVGTALLAFRLGYLVPFVSPLLAVILSFISVQTLEYATEGRQKRFLKHAFKHYLSPQVIDRIVDDPSRLALGGERKELTLFFSDLASFTTLSERLEPEKLVAVLNRYLSEMTDIILREGGTLDKYEGDAIIAFWNAPADQEDHAERALRASMFCLERLKEINPELQQMAGSPLSMRIGVHTGPVVVGNLGSRERFDYTIIGDAANLASRLEGLGKVFRAPMIISEATWKMGEKAVKAREIGTVRVVGRKEATRIYQPGVRRGDMPFFRWWKEDDSSFADALAAYYAGEIARAHKIFADLEDDPVAGMYRERCAELMKEPLPGDWDGVWEMMGK